MNTNPTGMICLSMLLSFKFFKTNARYKPHWYVNCFVIQEEKPGFKNLLSKSWRRPDHPGRKTACRQKRTISNDPQQIGDRLWIGGYLILAPALQAKNEERKTAGGKAGKTDGAGLRQTGGTRFPYPKTRSPPFFCHKKPPSYENILYYQKCGIKGY